MDRVSLMTVLRFGFVLAAATLVTGCGRKPAAAGSARSMADTVTSADGIRIAYETQGKGTPALVFADRALVERVAADMSAAPPAVAIGALESAISFDREIPRALQELKLPVVAINPDYKPTDVESMERHGVQVVLMSGVGHFLMMEDPERFNRLLRTVIDKLVR